MINYHHPKRPINYVHPGRSNNTPAQGTTIVLQKGQTVILRSSGAVRA